MAFIVVSLLAFAGAEPARALPAPAADPVGASDTGRGPAVHADARVPERWYCTPTGCAGARGSSASAALGFAATALAAAWLSRQRPSDRC